MEAHESLFGCLVCRLLGGALEPGSPLFLTLLRQVADHVFPFVPLAALNFGPLAEHLTDHLTQALATVDNAENAFFEVKPRSKKSLKSSMTGSERSALDCVKPNTFL